MTDTHAHIYLPEFDSDRKVTVQRAMDAGVQKIFMPNIDSESIGNMLETARAFPDTCFPMMGLHPCSVKENYIEELELVQQYFDDGAVRFYGVGECGLDYYWDKMFIPQQKEAFAFQIELAKRYRLPLIIHSRESIDDCIEMVAARKDENLRGIFHCFSGNILQLEKIIALGFYAGIGGVVTFKNGGLDKILTTEHVPHLVLETDAPYLAPVPFRGKRNEPAYLAYIVQKLSEVTGMEEDALRLVTESNAQRLFGE